MSGLSGCGGPLKNNVGITATHCQWSEAARSRFALFHSVMIKREVFDKIGMLDEAFLVGAGEDTDFCIRAEIAGYKVVDVDGIFKVDHGAGLAIGTFPIYHPGGTTVKKTENWNEVFNGNGRLLEEKWQNRPMKLNLGCGKRRLDGYVNIDLYEPSADMKVDIHNLSMFKTNSVTEIFASHVIEHISPYFIQGVLIEWHRILMPGAKLILELPDILECCKQFVTASKAERYGLLTTIYGAIENVKVPHLYGWEIENLTDYLHATGFKDVIKLPPQIGEGQAKTTAMRVEAVKK